MRVDRSGLDAETFEQRFADEMRRLALGGAEAEIDAGLAIEAGHELRMAIGEMQQAHVAERRHVVHRRGRSSLGEHVAGRERESGGGPSREHLQEFAAVHA